MLAGDIQPEAIEYLLTTHHGLLGADIVELPHHGSHNEDCEEFIRKTDPRIVLQSTGYTRLRDDRWAAALSNVKRLITARDGACWVEIDEEGKITTGSFIRGSGDPTSF